MAEPIEGQNINDTNEPLIKKQKISFGVETEGTPLLAKPVIEDTTQPILAKPNFGGAKPIWEQENNAVTPSAAEINTPINSATTAATPITPNPAIASPITNSVATTPTSGVQAANPITPANGSLVQAQKLSPEAKKKIGIGTIITAGAIACIALLCFVFSFIADVNKLNWKDSIDARTDIKTPGSVAKLELEFSKDKNLDKIKIGTSCGEVKREKRTITWKLGELGENCKLDVSYSFRTISKEYKIIDLAGERGKDLMLEEEPIDETSTEDFDGDGLSNAEETKLKTDPGKIDSDNDGLSDGDEVNKHKSNPLKADSDDDGLDDYNEVSMGLDPNKTKSDESQSKNDGERDLEYRYDSANISAKVQGSGNIASTEISSFPDTKLSQRSKISERVFHVTPGGEAKNIEIAIKLNDKELAKKNQLGAEVGVYTVNKDSYDLTEVKSSSNGGSVTFSLAGDNARDYFFIGEKSMDLDYDGEILLELDNSWSLYSDEQILERVDEEDAHLFTGNSDAHDVEGKRFEVSNKLVDDLTSKGFKVGISEFRSDFAMGAEVGSSAGKLHATIEKLKNEFITEDPGTGIYNAMWEGMDNFTNAPHAIRYIISLTDGENNRYNYDPDEVIEKAKEMDVKICIVGFGEAVNQTDLARIAEETGCGFYSASSVDSLSSLFGNVMLDVNNGFADLNEDGMNESFLVSDSGFEPQRDGFSFSNFGSSDSDGGNCAGMARFAQLYYLRKHPLRNTDPQEGLENKMTRKFDLRYASDFDRRTPLYDYKLSTEALVKYTPGEAVPMREMPSHIGEDGKIYFDGDFRKQVLDSGIIDVVPGGEFSRFHENFIVKTVDNRSGKTPMSSTEQAMFDAIAEGQLLQFQFGHFRSTSFIDYVFNSFGDQWSEQIEAPTFIKYLQVRLSNGEPLVFSVPGHAMNLIAMYADTYENGVFYLDIYDNNRPGISSPMRVECGKIQCEGELSGNFQYLRDYWVNQEIKKYREENDREPSPEEIKEFQEEYRWVPLRASIPYADALRVLNEGF